MGPNVRNTIVPTRLNTIGTWHGVAKQISKPIPSNSKLPKANPIHIASSASIAKAIIKWTATYICSENSGSTVIGTTKNHKSSKKSEPTQFTCL